MVALVGDFGLAKLIPEATEILSSDLDSSALLMGSIGYVAPGTSPRVFFSFLKIICEVICN